MSIQIFGYIVFFLISVSSVVAVFLVPRLHKKSNSSIRNLEINGNNSEYKKYNDYNDFLDKSNLADALARLEVQVDDFSPDHIVGVNHGGIILAALLANRLGLPQQSVSRLSVEGGHNRPVEVYKKEGVAEINFNSDKVLIIDDMVRSGETISRLVNFFKENREINQNLKFGSLVVNTDHVDKVDFFGGLTNSKDVIFFWTGEERKRKSRENTSAKNRKLIELIGFDILAEEIDENKIKYRRKIFGHA